MKCPQCGERLSSTRENVKYDASGLPGVTLGQVEVRRCAECGEYEIVIPKIEALHKILAQGILRKRARLTPPEIRFLRKYLGWSGADFARAMGAKPETVSRWETGAAPMGTQADRLLRLMVAHLKPVEDYGEAAILGTALEEASPTRMIVTLQRGEWASEGRLNSFAGARI